MYGRGARSIACDALTSLVTIWLGVVERRGARSRSSSAGLLVVVVRVAPVDVRRLRGHRRVEVQRQQRDLAALDEPVELPDDLLGAADRERRHEQHAIGLGDEMDGLDEDPDRLVLGLVFAATVRRLDEDVVRGRHDGRVAQDRCPGPAEVARADDDALLATLAVLDAQPDDRRPEDVPGIEERGPDPGRDLALLVVVDGPEVLERPLGVLHRVERARRGRSRAPAAGARRSASGSRRPATAVAPGSTLVSTCSPIDRRRRPWRPPRAAPPTLPVRRPSRPRPPPRSRRRPPGRPRPGRRPPPCGRPPRPRPDGASPSAPRAWRTPRAGARSRGARAWRARRCPPSRGSAPRSRP